MKTTDIASAATKRVPNAPGGMPVSSGGNALVRLPVHLVVPANEMAEPRDVIATANAGQGRSVLQGLKTPRAVTVIADRVHSRETFGASAANGRPATCARAALSVHDEAPNVATDSVLAVVTALPSEAIAKAPLSGATTALSKASASAETVGKPRSLGGRAFGPEHQIANGRAERGRLRREAADAATAG